MFTFAMAQFLFQTAWCQQRAQQTIFPRRSLVPFTTANMATATKIIQRLRNFLSGVRHATTDKFYMLAGTLRCCGGKNLDMRVICCHKLANLKAEILVNFSEVTLAVRALA